MEDTRTKAKKVFIMIILVLISCTLLFLWFYFLGWLLGTAALVLIFFSLITFLVKFFIFPGAFKIWRRWWQAKLEAELAQNFIDHLHELKYCLEILKSSINTIHIKKNSIQLHESLEIFSVIINNYRGISISEFSKIQKKFVDLINAVHKKMTETVIVFPKQSENLWVALDNTKEYEWSNVTFEDFPDNMALKDAIDAFEGLEQFVVPYTVTTYPRCLFQEGIFTNLNILRGILSTSCCCEQYWVSSEGGDVDCVLVKSFEAASDPPVMIFCNPNGGLYEYSCYQNHWLEFYINNGIDLFMWNYRGYGRTKGSPSSNAFRADGQAVYDFLSKVKMYKKIGIHGESIGGMVASYISCKNEIDFLFADRAFSTLDALVESRTHINRCIFKCFAKWNDCTLDDFLNSGCYKILSCDPEDDIIPEKASLKTGIALRQSCNDLDRGSLTEFFEAVKNVRKYAERFKISHKEQKDSQLEVTHNSIYINVEKENFALDEDSVGLIALKIYSSLNIDAGGLSLHDVKTESELKSWIRVFQIWGSFLPVGSNAIGKDKAQQKLANSIEILADVFRENGYVVDPNVVNLCRQAKFLKEGLSKLQKFVENFYGMNSEELTSKDGDVANSSRVGHLVPVGCGHAGKFNDEEKKLVIHHLKQAKFIP